MFSLQKRILFEKTIILSWAIFCVLIFIYLPGSITHIYGSSLGHWQSFFSKLAQIEIFSYFFNLIKAIIWIVIFSLAGTSIGSFFIFLIQKKQIEIIDWSIYLCTAFLVGQGLLSISFLTLAILSQLTFNNITLTLGLSALIGIPFLIKLALHDQQTIRGISLNPKREKFNTILVYLIGMTLLFSLLTSTARLSYDSVAMYFSDAKITALTHKVAFFPNESYIVSSFHTGIHYAAIIQVFGDQTARLYSWVNGLIILIFLLALSHEFGFSRRAKLILLILMLTSTAFSDLMGDGKIDLACTAPIVAAIYWMVINKENTSKHILLLCGFLIGYAMAARPYNIFLMGAFTALFYLQSIYRRKTSGTLGAYNALFKPAIFIGVGLTLWLFIHMLANYYILSDPLAFIHNYQKVDSSIWQWAIDPNYIWLVRLFYPVAVTFLNTPQSLGNISPLFIALATGILISDIRKRINITSKLLTLIIAAGITLILWITLFFTVFEIRYIFFLWFIFFLPGALIIEQIMESYDHIFQVVIKAIIISILIFTAFRLLFVSIDSYSPIDNAGNPQCNGNFLCTHLPSINQQAVPGDRVLTLSAFRYYLREDLFSCSTTHEEYNQFSKLSTGDSETFWVEVYHQGYKFIAFEENYSKRHLFMKLFPAPVNTPAWLTLKPIFGEPGDPIVSYQIITKNPPLISLKSCTKNQEGVWEIK